MLSHYHSLIDTLALDHRRGAAEIAKDSISLFADIAKTATKNPSNANQLFIRAIRCLAKGQPSMASILNLLNDLCIIFEQSGGNWDKIIEDTNIYQTAFNLRKNEMLLNIDSIPKPGGVLIAYSNSSTVAEHIIECKRRFEWPLKVYCSESRPMMEGLVMARKLKSENVPTTIFTDAALMSRTGEADSVWVGGDCITEQGLVNKVGSKALGLIADKLDIPFITLMTSDKLLHPTMLPFFKFRRQNPREIAADEADDFDVFNEYYESVPLDLVSYVYSEIGLLKPGNMINSITGKSACSYFKELLQG